MIEWQVLYDSLIVFVFIFQLVVDINNYTLVIFRLPNPRGKKKKKKAIANANFLAFHMMHTYLRRTLAMAYQAWDLSAFSMLSA